MKCCGTDGTMVWTFCRNAISFRAEKLEFPARKPWLSGSEMLLSAVKCCCFFFIIHAFGWRECVLSMGTKKQKESSRLPDFFLFSLFFPPAGERRDAYLPWFSSLTVSFLRPFARRDASTRRPFFVAILCRKPCLLARLLLCGWNVLFIVVLWFYFVVIFISSWPGNQLLGCKSTHKFSNDKVLYNFYD